MGILPVFQLPATRLLPVRVAQSKYAQPRQRRRFGPAKYRLFQLASTAQHGGPVPTAPSTTSGLVQHSAVLDEPFALLATHERHARIVDLFLATLLPGLVHPDVTPRLPAVIIRHIALGGRHRCDHCQSLSITHVAFAKPYTKRIAQAPGHEASRIIDGLGRLA